MKNLFKKSLLVLMIVFISVFTLSVSNKVKAADKYVETSFGEGKILITTTFNGSTYYLPAASTGSQNPPVATLFTDLNAISEDNLWTVTASGTSYCIQNNNEDYLYTTNTNNGVRVGGTEGTWLYNNSDNSLKFVNTDRFLGIYNAQDWRCYTSVNQTNYKESSTSFKFYKVSAEDSAEVVANREKVNKINSYMQMAYKYTVDSSTVNVANSATITFDNASKRTLSENDKQVWEENSIKITYQKGTYNSNLAEYANPIRFYAGTTVTISYPTAIKTVEFMCSSESYASALAKATGGSFTTDSTDKKKVVLTLNSEVNSVTISMTAQVRVNYIEVKAQSAGTTTIDTYSEVEFRLRCGVDATLAAIEGIQSYGIQVTANNKTEKYIYDSEVAGFGSTTFIDEKTGEEKELIYVVLSLGDLINYNRLDVEFTVQAFAVINGVTYVSESTKTYSIADMVIEYYESGISEVSGLYDLITENLQ